MIQRTAIMWNPPEVGEGGGTQQWEAVAPAGSTTAAASSAAAAASPPKMMHRPAAGGGRLMGPCNIGPGVECVQRHGSRIVFVLMHRSASQLHVVGGEHWTDGSVGGGGGVVSSPGPGDDSEQPKPTALQLLETPGHAIAGFAVHPLLDLVFTAGLDGSLIAYNFKSATQVWCEKTHCDSVTALAVADDVLLSAAQDAMTVATNTSSGERLWRFDWHNPAPTADVVAAVEPLRPRMGAASSYRHIPSGGRGSYRHTLGCE
eukprot:COSAG01_NODE_2258_length_8063_cov_10.409216_1_plen_260_part_00